MEPNYPFDPYDWATISPLFTALLDKPVASDEFAEWLAAWNNLDIAVNDAWTELKRRSYTDTTNLEAERSYLIFTRGMFSTYLGLHSALAKRALYLHPQPPSPAHEQLWRRWRNQATLFHLDSLPLQAEISELESGYRELMRHIEQLPGNATVHWMERRDELNALMLRLLKLRRELAHVSGLPTFLAFRWRELNRLDFTVEECQQFHRATEEVVIPALLKLREETTQEISPPEILDPIVHADGVGRMLSNFDPTFGAIFDAMRDGYLDLGTRPGKAVTSEQWFFPRTGMPYLHSASTNLGTTLHECGHAVHAYLSFQAHPSMWNYVGPDEFQEFAAVALDMLCWPYYEQTQGGFYTAKESAAAFRETILRDYLGTIAWGVMEDAFEHWVYGEASGDVTPDELDAKWLELTHRFMPWKVTEGSELEVMTGWQRGNWSLFRMPLYTIAYAINTIAVCLFGRELQTDRLSVMANYKESLLLGNTKPLPELFGAAGVPFPFLRQDVEDALQFALDEYARLSTR